MTKIIYAIKVNELSYSGLKILDVKIGRTTNINSTLAQYRRSNRLVEVLDLWEPNPSKRLSKCEKGIHKIAERYAYERKEEKFIFLQESYKRFSKNVKLLLKTVSKDDSKKGARKRRKPDSYIGKKPKLIIFKGRKHKINTWREALHTVAREIYKEQDDFSPALKIKGRIRDYFSKNRKDLAAAQKIKDTPYFFEGQNNADQTMKIIRKLLEIFGYKNSDLEVRCK